MSTPNFARPNTSKIYAISQEEDDDEGFIYDDTKSNITYELKKAGVYPTPDARIQNDNRSYPGDAFAEVTIQRGKWQATIQLIMRGGYYSGANLDLAIQVEDTTAGDTFDYFDEAANITSSTMLKAIQQKINRIESAYALYSTPLICAGIFSNGEAIYELAGQDKPMFTN